MSPQPQEDLIPAIRIVPHVDGPRSLRFDIIERDVPDGVVIKIGRFTDKALVANRVTFKSKVVSRGHAEIWSEGNKFFIRDTKSSSGTFLNHSRLSTPGAESKAFQLNDGDIVQLGVDYQGGTEDAYRVKSFMEKTDKYIQ
ncbi:12530_t:CDS:2, partial [Acaulospora morrowiae]